MVIHSVPNKQGHHSDPYSVQTYNIYKITKVNVTVEIKRDCDLRPDSKDSQNESDNGLVLTTVHFLIVYNHHWNKFCPFDQALLLVSRVTASVFSSLLCHMGETMALWDSEDPFISFMDLFFYPLLFLSLPPSCLYFLHSKVKPTGSGACLAPPVPEFQHSKPSENQSGKKRRDAVPSKLQVLAMMNINLAIKTSSSSFFLVLN